MTSVQSKLDMKQNLLPTAGVLVQACNSRDKKDHKFKASLEYKASSKCYMVKW